LHSDSHSHIDKATHFYKERWGLTKRKIKKKRKIEDGDKNNDNPAKISKINLDESVNVKSESEKVIVVRGESYQIKIAEKGVNLVKGTRNI
jgi:hypothetical protein